MANTLANTFLLWDLVVKHHGDDWITPRDLKLLLAKGLGILSTSAFDNYVGHLMDLGLVEADGEKRGRRYRALSQPTEDDALPQPEDRAAKHRAPVEVPVYLLW